MIAMTVNTLNGVLVIVVVMAKPTMMAFSILRTKTTRNHQTGAIEGDERFSTECHASGLCQIVVATCVAIGKFCKHVCMAHFWPAPATKPQALKF
mmetsp:Transcript_120676/g.240298  ORF Transcript_120676/g.240298 Transcript_120676/m.240298 type:complete len:95 (+) Transcript_120676:2-286(+)